MKELSLGVIARSRKPDEYRLPIHPAHLDRIDPAVRRRVFLEVGYGERFGFADNRLSSLVGGLRSREQLVEECDVILLPKPPADDLADLRVGQVLWGWPHCVQDETVTQLAIDRRLTVIAWEAMNHWAVDGVYQVQRKKLRALILVSSRTASSKANTVCRMTTTTAYSAVFPNAFTKSWLPGRRT